MRGKRESRQQRSKQPGAERPNHTPQFQISQSQTRLQHILGKWWYVVVTILVLVTVLGAIFSIFFNAVYVSVTVLLVGLGVILPIIIQPIPLPSLRKEDNNKVASNPRGVKALTMIRVAAGILALLLISGGFIISTSYLLTKPYQNSIHATSTAISNVTGTAHVISIGSAAAKTATAEASMIAASTAQVTAIDTVVAVNQYPPYTGSIAMNDPLSDNSQGNGWQDSSGLGTDKANNCKFSGGAYNVEAVSGIDCYMLGRNFPVNLTFEINMKILTGTCAGIFIHRYNENVSAKHYSYYICQDGSFELFTITSKSTHLVTFDSSQAIKVGSGQSNTIAIVANGNKIDFYVNHQRVYHYVSSDADASFQETLVGVSVFARDGNRVGVLFSQAKAWILE